MVRPQSVEFFKRRQLMEGQKFLKNMEDGSAVYQVDIYHKKPFLSRIAYWIPTVTILEPEELKDEFLTTLNDYLLQEKR